MDAIAGCPSSIHPGLGWEGHLCANEDRSRRRHSELGEESEKGTPQAGVQAEKAGLE